jgi:hypothetical protein
MGSDIYQDQESLKRDLRLVAHQFIGGAETETFFQFVRRTVEGRSVTADFLCEAAWITRRNFTSRCAIMLPLG